MQEVSANGIHQIVNLDEDFEIVVSKLGRFNPFDILGITHHEYRHSNVIAWLLNPNENHNLQDAFFRKIVLHTLLSSENDEKSSDIAVSDITGNSFDDIEVLREEQNADIVLLSRIHKMIIIIENKILSSEHSNQLQRYRTTFKENYNDYKHLYIYLTLEGDAPSDDQYYILTYSTILHTLEHTLRTRKDIIPEKIIDFLSYYAEAIRELSMEDKDLVILCRKVYAKYKKEIDYIYSIGNAVDVSIAVDDFQKCFPEVNVYWNDQKSIWFNTPDLRLGKKLSPDWGEGYPYSFWFENYSNTNLKLVLEIGPFSAGDMRVAFLEKLEKNDVQFRQSAKDPNRMYTRIWTRTVKIRDWFDKDEVLEAMKKLYTNETLRKTYDNLVKTIKEFPF